MGETALSKEGDESERELERSQLRHQLSTSDLELVRAIEDLIYLLIDKGIIAYGDLPDAVRDKLNERQMLRHRLSDLLAGSEGDEGGGLP